MKNINRKVRLQAFCNAIKFYYDEMLPKLDVSSSIPQELQNLINNINALDANDLDSTTMLQLYKQLKKAFESQKIEVPPQTTQESDNEKVYASTTIRPPKVYLEVPKLKVLEAIYSAEQMHKELKALELNDYQEEGDYEFAGKKRTPAEMQAFKQHFSEEKYISEMTPSMMWKWYQFACADPADTTAHYAVMGRKVHPHIIAYRKALVREWALENQLLLPLPQDNPKFKIGSESDFYTKCINPDFKNLGNYLPPAVATYRDGMKGNPFSSHHYREIETTKEDGTIEKKKELVLIQQRSGLVVPMHMFQDKSALMPAFIKKWRYPDNYQEVLEATKENILDQLRQAIIARDRDNTTSEGGDFPFLLQNLMNLGNEPEGVGALTEKILLQAVTELQRDLADENPDPAVNKRIKLLQRMGVLNENLRPRLHFSWQPVKTSGKVMGVLFSPLQAGWRYLKIKMGVLSRNEIKMGVLFTALDKWLGQGKYKILEKPKGNRAEVDKLWNDYQLSSYEKGFPRDTIIKSALEINMYHRAGGGSSSSCKSGKDRRYAVKITADALAELYATYPDFSLTSTDPQKTFTATINGVKFQSLSAFDLLELKVAELFIEKRGTLVSELNAPGAEGIKGLADMLGKGICSHIDMIATQKELPHSQDGESYVKYLKESSSFNKLEMGLGKKILKRFKGDLAKNEKSSAEIDVSQLSGTLKAQIGVYPYRPSAELMKSAVALFDDAKAFLDEAADLMMAAAELPKTAPKRVRLEAEIKLLQEEGDEALDKSKKLKEKSEILKQQEDTLRETIAAEISSVNPRKVEAEVSRRKVEEILGSGLTPKKQQEAQDTLYKDTYPLGEEPTEARERFLAFLENRLADPNCPKYPKAPPHKDAKAAASSMKSLLGSEGIKLYEAAVAEERKTRAYRDAVFLAATQHVKGEKWTKRLILWIGGSSAIGKSFATKLAIESMKKKMSIADSLDADGNYIVAEDGGIEREVCHMKKAALQLALNKKYSGIRDIMKHTDLHIKSKVKKAADHAGLSIASPNTFSNPFKRSKKLKAMQDYADDENVIQAFVEIKPSDKDEARAAVRACCDIQGTGRAYADNPGTVDSIDLHSDATLPESKDHKLKYYEDGRKGSRNAANFFKSLISAVARVFIIPNEIHPVFISYDGGEYKAMPKKGIRMDAADWEKAKKDWDEVKHDLLDIEKPKWLKKWVRRKVTAAKLEPQDVTELKESELVKKYLQDNHDDYDRAINVAIKDAKKAQEENRTHHQEVCQKAIEILTSHYQETVTEKSRTMSAVRADLETKLRDLKGKKGALSERDKKLLKAVAEYNLTHKADKIAVDFGTSSFLGSYYDGYLEEKAKAIAYGLLAQYQTYAVVQEKLAQPDFMKDLNKDAIKVASLLPEDQLEAPRGPIVFERDEEEPSVATGSKSVGQKAKDQDKKDAQSIIGLFDQALQKESEKVFDEKHVFGKEVESVFEQVKTHVIFQINSASDRSKEFQYYWNVLMHLKESWNGEGFYAVGLGLKQCVKSLGEKIKLKPAQKELIDFFNKDQVVQREWLRKNKLSIPLELLKNKTPGAEAEVETCVLVGEAVSQAFQLSKGKHLSEEAIALQEELVNLTQSMQKYVNQIEQLKSKINELLDDVEYLKNQDLGIKNKILQTLRDELKHIKKDHKKLTQDVHIKSELELLEAKITAAEYLLEASSDVQAALRAASADLESTRDLDKINNLTKVIHIVLKTEQEQRPLMNLKRFISFIEDGKLESTDDAFNEKIYALLEVLKEISKKQALIIASGSEPDVELVEAQIALIKKYVKVYDELRFFHKINEKNIEEQLHLKMSDCLNIPEVSFLKQLSTHVGVSDTIKSQIGEIKKELAFNRTIVELFSRELDFQKKMEAFSGRLDVRLPGVEEFQASIKKMIEISQRIQALKTLERENFKFEEYLFLVAEQQKNIRQYKIRLTVVQSAGVQLPMADMMEPIQRIMRYPMQIEQCISAASKFQPDLYALDMLHPVKEQVTAFNLFQKLIDDELLPKRKAFLDAGVPDETLQAAFLEDLIYAEKNGKCAAFMAMERVALEVTFSGASATEKSALLGEFKQCMEEVSVTDLQRGKELFDGFITYNLESIKSLAKADVESGNEKGDQKFIAALKGAVKEEYQVWCRHFALKKQFIEARTDELLLDIIGFNILNPKQAIEKLEDQPDYQRKYQEVIATIAYGLLVDIEEKRKELLKKGQDFDKPCFQEAIEKADDKFKPPVSTEISQALERMSTHSQALAMRYVQFSERASAGPYSSAAEGYAAALIELFNARTACYYFHHFGPFGHPLNQQDLHEYLASKVLMDVSAQSSQADQEARITFYLDVLALINPETNEEAFVALKFALSAICTEGENKRKYEQIIEKHKKDKIARSAVTRQVVNATNPYLKGKCFKPLFLHEEEQSGKLQPLSKHAEAILADLQKVDTAMTKLGSDKERTKNALQARLKDIKDLGVKSIEDILSLTAEVKVMQDSKPLTGTEALKAVLKRLVKLKQESQPSSEKIDKLITEVEERVRLLEKAIRYTDNYKDKESIMAGIERASRKCSQHQDNEEYCKFYQKLIQHLSEKFAEKVGLEKARETPVVPLVPNPMYEPASAPAQRVLRLPLSTSKTPEQILVDKVKASSLVFTRDTDRGNGNPSTQPEIVQKAFAEIKKKYDLDLDHIDYRACDSATRKAIHDLMCAVIDRLPLKSAPTDGQSAPSSKPILWPRVTQLRASSKPIDGGSAPSETPKPK